jgi:Arc/MetJ family transcription regulator
MRTNIDIDDELLARSLEANPGMTKKAIVEKALRLLVDIHGQTGIRKLRGKVQWEGNLHESRLSRGEDWTS